MAGDLKEFQVSEGYIAMLRVWGLLSITAAAFVGFQDARSAEPLPKPAQAEQVTVTGQATGSLTSASSEESAKQETQIPGGFTVKSAGEMRMGRASNFEDLLQRAPGVFLQSDGGTEVSKISVRGSGITSEDEPIGVMFLLDGLSYNQADGETILEDFDVNTLGRAEIFRDAAAFKYGALTLGGAINLVPLTGDDAAPFQTRIEGGSYGYIRTHISGGAVEGPLDEFASISFRSRSGFREHSRENTEILFADAGDKFSEQIEDRFYLTLDRSDRDLPGGLTKAEMENGPSRANPLAIAQDWNRNWSYIRIANKLSLRTEQFEFDAGVFWFHRDFEQRGFFSTLFRQGIHMYYSDNFGGNLNFVSHSDLFGYRNLFTIGLSPQRESENSQNYENLSGHAGRTTARGENISLNVPFYFENQFYVTRQFSILAGAQAIFARRHFRDAFARDAEGNQSHQQDFYGFNPKMGAIYELDQQTQVFANLSRSWQPPSFDNLVEFATGPDSSVVYTPLSPQHAWTIEIGTRGQYSRIEWELSLYRSWVRNELLALNDAFGNDIGSTNIARSIHQGIELGLEVELLRGIWILNHGNQTGDRISLDQTYTLNDFHFDGDPVYHDNRIAGIPIHFYEAQLLYQAPSGFYAGPNLQCNLSRYPADHANTLFADAYALVGFRAGFRRGQGLSVFLDCRNLTNARYASSIDVIADARTDADPEIFHPGDGRAFYCGASWSW
jgi:iron complex outermembrane receptor protein